LAIHRGVGRKRAKAATNRRGGGWPQKGAEYAKKQTAQSGLNTEGSEDTEAEPPPARSRRTGCSQSCGPGPVIETRAGERAREEFVRVYAAELPIRGE